MLGTKKKFKKKTGKKAFPIEVKKESVPNDVRHASPPPIPGEKLLAVLQDWKSQSQNAIMLNAANSMEIKTAQQDSKELKLIFKCVDTNNTGFLHEGEVQSALELLGFVINNTGQERIKKWTDSNEGRLSFRVFKELVAEWHGETRDFYNELKKGFSMIDHDKDGRITVDDLREASKLAGISFSRQELEAMVEEADQNGDHAVDISEFIEIMLKTNLF